VLAVIQRVQRADVRVDDEVIGEIGPGLLVLLGVGRGDTSKEARWLSEKIAELRIFNDADGRMNSSLEDVGGSLLVVSQFTLFGNCNKGRRPSFAAAAPPDLAEQLYEEFVVYLRERGLPVETGRFAAKMAVSLINDGPVTLSIDSTTRGNRGPRS
jgi:D-tyrosyl-tRNA(Tyr) deacylase